ncbi:MAG: ferrous iron transport protein A [Clostridia bacterium]|nr:ferrous iron transport protein A [Clostridia bacterium]
MQLSQLSIGQTATVTAISNDCAIKRRLQDIGLIEGTEVCCIFISPLGDPKAFFIRDTVIALRKKDASKITVSEV